MAIRSHGCPRENKSRVHTSSQWLLPRLLRHATLAYPSEAVDQLRFSGGQVGRHSGRRNIEGTFHYVTGYGEICGLHDGSTEVE